MDFPYTHRARSTSLPSTPPLIHSASRPKKAMRRAPPLLSPILIGSERCPHFPRKCMCRRDTEKVPLPRDYYRILALNCPRRILLLPDKLLSSPVMPGASEAVQ